MNEEEKKAINDLKRTVELYEAKPIDNISVEFDEFDYKIVKIVLNLIKKLQKENKKLKEKENKIYKEVQESLAFEKFLIVKERKPDLFNQGRFYISQIIYDILNDVQNPEGIHKENKCIQYIDYIPVQKVKDKIEELQKEYNKLDKQVDEYIKSVEKDVSTYYENKERISIMQALSYFIDTLQELIEEREGK